MRLAIFSAFPQEISPLVKNLNAARISNTLPFPLFRAPYGSGEVIVVQTGMGTRNTETSLNYVVQEYSPTIILSSGFGGALYDEAAIGELIWASRVLLVNDRIRDTLDLPDRDQLFHRLSQKLMVREGSIVTLERWMKKHEIKRALSEPLSFPVCDMETFPLAKASLTRGLPFAAIRSITDRSHEEIPPELLCVADESGNYRFARAMKVLLRNPSLIPRAISLGRGSATASRNLWCAVKALMDVLHR
jgi:nucleoside phosphorylase